MTVSSRLHERYIQYRGYRILLRCYRCGDTNASRWTIQVDVAEGEASPMLQHRDANHGFATLEDAEHAGFAWGRRIVEEILQ